LLFDKIFTAISKWRVEMNKKLEILLNEYKELSLLRERSIKNIEECIRTYITFLGFVITSIAIGSTGENSGKTIIQTTTIAVAILVGIFIHHWIISSNINQTMYTRKLNLTRKYIIDKRRIDRLIHLPTSGDRPNFDNLGFFGEKLSVHGVLGLVKIINGILSGVLLVYIFLLIRSIPANIFFYSPEFWIQTLFIGVVIVSLVFCLHNCHNQKMIERAEKQWAIEIQEKKV
jgi:hypothetical protein